MEPLFIGVVYMTVCHTNCLPSVDKLFPQLLTFPRIPNDAKQKFQCNYLI